MLVLLASGLAAWAWVQLGANGARIREAYATELSRVRSAFLEDQNLARSHPVLGPAGRASDAGPVLNPRIGWDGDPHRLARWLERLPQRPRPLLLDPALVERIPEEWWTTPPEVWEGLDFSWLATLAPFDHWDVESNSPWAEARADEWPNGFPLFFELTPWVKLHLARALAKDRLAGAVAEVEHLAALLLSTETLLGAAQGLQALRLVDVAFSWQEGQGRAAPSPGGRMDATTRSRAFRATMAARVFLLAEAPVSVRGDAERILVGRCAALNEAFHSAVALQMAIGREQGEPAHWLPLDGPVASSCRLTGVRRALALGWPGAEGGRSGRCRAAPAGLRAACRGLLFIPFVASLERRLTREILLQMALANAARVAWYEGGGAVGCPGEPAE